LQKRLFKYFQPLPRGVNVYLLQDGTYVQDAATPENSNTAIPYPIGTADNLVSRQWDPFTLTEIDTPVINPVVKVYLGAHNNQVTTAEAAALTAAGYGAYLS
jgi:hypothetical protein